MLVRYQYSVGSHKFYGIKDSNSVVLKLIKNNTDIKTTIEKESNKKKENPCRSKFEKNSRQFCRIEHAEKRTKF